LTASVRVEVRRLDPRAEIPRRATPGASGFDLTACLDGDLVLEPGRTGLVPTGLALAIPPGHEGQVRARSGLALRHGISVLNGPGTIDSDYRGEIRVVLVNHGTEPLRIAPGDRIAQLLVQRVERATFARGDDLGSTGRGEGGFGSTGRN